MKGYKISNHICLGFYLRDVLMRIELYRKFDDLRFKRNSLTYYGNMMEFDIAKQSIDICKDLINEIKDILEK